MISEFSATHEFLQRYFPLALKLILTCYNRKKPPRLIYRAESAAQTIRVVDQGNFRYLKFGEGSTPVQSFINLKHLDYIMMRCHALMLCSLFLNPSPQSILIIGLGGGILSRTLAKICPDAKIVNVEYDPKVAEIAKKHFHFKPTKNQVVIIDEGRNHIEQALKDNQKYDLIMLDAFGKNYIPQDLMSLECLESIRSLLPDHGVLAANTFSASSLYDQESVTYSIVFGKFYQLKYDNRIILAQKNRLQSFEDIKNNAKSLEAQFKDLNIQVRWLTKLFNTIPDWNPDVNPLSDRIEGV